MLQAVNKYIRRLRISCCPSHKWKAVAVSPDIWVLGGMWLHIKRQQVTDIGDDLSLGCKGWFRAKVYKCTRCGAIVDQVKDSEEYFEKVKKDSHYTMIAFSDPS